MIETRAYMEPVFFYGYISLNIPKIIIHIRYTGTAFSLQYAYDLIGVKPTSKHRVLYADKPTGWDKEPSTLVVGS